MPQQGLINLLPLRKALSELEKQIVNLQGKSGELERRSRLASAMLDATREISSSLSFPAVINQILDGTQNLLGARCSSIMLFDREVNELRVVGSRGIDSETVRELRFRAGEGIAGYVLDSGDPILIEDASHDERFVLRNGHTPKAESIACVPLRDSGRVLGVLSMDKPLDARDPLSEDELAYLIFLADHAAVALKNARLHEDLAHRVTQLSTLYEVGSALTSVLNVDRLLSKIIDGVVQVTGAQICSLMMLDTDRNCLRVRVAKGLTASMMKKINIPIGEGISGHVAKTGEPLLIADIENHPLFKKRSLKKYSSSSLLTVPLKIKGKVMGVLNVNNKQPAGVFTAEDQNLLTLFANQASVLIENANLYENMERLATTDGLTGLAVHRHFQETLDEELRRAKRFQRPLSLMMMDIDHFKKVNDTYGHQAGDLVLKTVSEILKNSIYETDFAARYGGEEFVVIFPKTDPEGLKIKSEKIRQKIEEAEITVGLEKIKVTASFGIAHFPKDSQVAEEVLRYADISLYKSKQTGRNKVTEFKKTA